MKLPRWVALVTAPPAFVLVHMAVPWGISLLGARHGWNVSSPGFLNAAALVVVVAGAAGIVWGAAQHVRRTEASFEFQATPTFILLGGLYRYSRNPMYLCVLVMWVGWMLFYGSVSLAVAVAVIAVLMDTVVTWVSLL